MEIEVINKDFSVCKVKDYSQIDLTKDYVFIGKTDNENSLVCPTDTVPENAILKDDNWKAFRFVGILDFSLVGVLANVASLLAKENIPIFAVSTFNTDYIFVKKHNFNKALDLLNCNIS